MLTRPRREQSARRVLILVANLPVPLDRRVWSECRALRAAGYAVSVICPKGPGDPSYQEIEGVRIRKYAPWPQADGAIGFFVEFAHGLLMSGFLMLKVAAREGFDVVQACNPPDTLFLLAAPCKVMGKRFVFDQHDLCPEVYRSRFGDRASGLLDAGLLALERCTYALADHVISTNESYKRVATTRGAMAPSDVTVVRSGPDADRMRPGPPRPELKEGKAFLCCYLGIMGPQDGVDVLLRAIEVFVHERLRYDCHFALLGYGDCYESLRELADELDLGKWVTFTGRADETMISDYLRTADVGLSSDPFNPLNDVSTMNKTLEYMAFELPVVAFDLKETRVSGGEAAVYVEAGDVPGFADAVADLLDDPARRARMGGIGRERIETALGWEHQKKNYVGVFDALMPR